MTGLDHTRLHYRVAAVIVDGGQVLLHRAEIDDFWSLPGGHVELHEPAGDALRREMGEELGADVEVERLLWVVENFFEYAGHRHHELGLYFLVRLPPGSRLRSRTRPFSGQEGGLHLTLRWFPCDARVLARLPVLPVFLQEGLVALPQTVQHVVNRE